MFEIMFPFPATLIIDGRAVKYTAESALVVKRGQLQTLYGCASISVRPIDEAGAALSPWLTGASCIEDAIKIADGEKE